MQSENLSTGQYNVLVGLRAGEDVDTANSLVLIGANAGQKLTNQTASVIIGSAAGSNLTADQNVIIGRSAAQQSTSASSCVIIGTYAGIDNQGDGNTLVGYYAGRGASGATDGHSNTFIGSQVGMPIRGGDNNTGVGYHALRYIQNGSYNTALGDRAGEALLNGSSNVFIGKNTGKLVTSGSNDIVIGSGAQASSATVSNEITLGNNSITKFRIPGIGVTLTDGIVTIPTPVIDVSGDVTVGGNFKVVGISTFSDDVTLTGASYSVLWDKSENALEFSDDARATFGDSKQLKIYRNSSGSTSTIENTQNILNISNTGTHTNIIASGNIYLKHGTNHAIVTRANAEVELYHNAQEKLATTSTGINVTGLTDTDTLTVSVTSTFQDDVTFQTQNGNYIVVDKSDNSLKFGDYVTAKFGDNSGNGDLWIYHDTGHSYIRRYGAGNLRLTTSSGKIQFQKHGADTLAEFNVDGSIDLYYDGTKRLETTSTGVTISDNLNLGNETAAGIASPVELNLGGTYRNAAGGNSKLKLWSDGSDQMGFGVSANQLDLIFLPLNL